jgi:hypothetical protein
VSAGNVSVTAVQGDAFAEVRVDRGHGGGGDGDLASDRRHRSELVTEILVPTA